MYWPQVGTWSLDHSLVVTLSLVILCGFETAPDGPIWLCAGQTLLADPAPDPKAPFGCDTS
jgi:hypothetical protein